MIKTNRAKRWLVIEYLMGHNKRCLGVFMEKRNADNCRHEYSKISDAKLDVMSLNVDLTNDGAIKRTDYLNNIDFNTHVPQQKFV